MDAHCKNCEVALQPDFDHCPKCGQNTRLHRLSLHELAHDAIHFFFHADRSLLSLVRELALRNGKVAREFIDGKRKKYYPPLTFFLLMAALNLFISTKTDDHVNVDVVKKYPELATIADAAGRAKWIEFYQRREHGIHFINSNANIIMMVALPIIALVFWLFYRRYKYNYTEHLVAGMYMFAFFTLMILVINLVGFFAKANENMVYGICLLLEIAYFTIFYRNFTESSRWKAFFASFFSILSLFLISMVVMSCYMFM